MKKSMLMMFLVVTALIATLIANAEMKESNEKAVAAVTQLENDQSKATNANDISWVQKNYADDWTGGFSGGTWMTKDSVLNDAKDSANNKMNSDQISDLKVRAYGNTAIATYTDSYDGMIRGEHRVKTVLSTDTWVRQNGQWKMVASHSCVAK
jgi:ketosteroid isomerase-like protein